MYQDGVLIVDISYSEWIGMICTIGLSGYCAIDFQIYLRGK